MKKKVLLDTNTVLYALMHNLLLPKKGYAISVLTEIELHACENFQKLITNFTVYPINKKIKAKAIEIKKEHKLSLDDSIVSATAIIHKQMLITHNKHLSKISNLDTFLITAWREEK
ncbi:MAG: Unknown protein [uncultured Sulfurovum sp.]|uniref:PIN domain-containing protein n=1 Tax=uncultured Sulfurovum sp. TaxID=269237 RepID=A0A6S6THA5_9BACT|nr:MAG: Unknown protein [uncultured Sulfurovum sp.]